MKARKDVLTRDDWDLTRGQLNSQRNAMIISLTTLEAAIENCEYQVSQFPEPKHGKDQDLKDETALNTGITRIKRDKHGNVTKV